MLPRPEALRRRRSGGLAVSLVIVGCGFAHAAAAQTIDGTAEWAYAQNGSGSAAQSNSNRSLWQNYTLGYSAPLWDPRLLKYNGEVSFHTDSLDSTATAGSSQHGAHRDLGYRIGAALFSASQFPISIQAARTNGTSSGDLAPGNAIRAGGGLLAPVASTVASQSDVFSVNGRMVLEGLPQVDLLYRTAHSTSAAGAYRAEQADGALAVGVTRETPRLRQAFRVERSLSDTSYVDRFTQRLATLDYTFAAVPTPRMSVTVQAGQRTTESRADSLRVIDVATEAYKPSSFGGSVSGQHAQAAYRYEPGPRVAFWLTQSASRQASDAVTTTANLSSASANIEVAPGLIVKGSGSAGTRGERASGTLVTAAVYNGLAGASFQFGPRWLEGSVAASQGMGRDITANQVSGITRSWAQEARVSSTMGPIGASAGYERVRSRDALLESGNVDAERYRASTHLFSSRFSVNADADQLRMTRMLTAIERSLQRSLSGNVACRLGAGSSVTAGIGVFSNDYVTPLTAGRDRTWFLNASGQLHLTSALRAVVSFRRDEVIATRSQLHQRRVNGFSRLEYQLRALMLSAEYRLDDNFLSQDTVRAGDWFRGRQFRVGVTRRFGLRL